MARSLDLPHPRPPNLLSRLRGFMDILFSERLQITLHRWLSASVFERSENTACRLGRVLGLEMRARRPDFRHGFRLAGAACAKESI